MLYKGNNELKNIYRGSHQISRIFKGDELIFQDLEALYGFKFTIDTTLASDGTHNNSDASFWFYGGNDTNERDRIVYWGDGTYSDSGNNANNFSHTYSTPGIYQILIMPKIVNGEPVYKGWLSKIRLQAENPTGYNGNGYKVVSIDTPYPEGSFVVYSASTWRQEVRDYVGAQRRYCISDGFRNVLCYLYNVQSIPLNLFDNAKVFYNEGNPGEGNPQMFATAFASCGKFTNYNVYPLAKRLIDSIDYSKIKSLNTFFAGTFSEVKGNIPADLFSSVQPTAPVPGYYAFQRCFSGAAYDTVDATIPTGLLPEMAITGDCRGMFSEMFDSFGALSTSGNIPADLLSNITISGITSSESMFHEMFNGAFPKSAVATIPDGLFSCLNGLPTPKTDSMFSRTFASFGSMSTVAEIPAGLFSAVNTSSTTTAGYMFSGTFESFAPRSTHSIPAHLFDTITLGNCNALPSVFQNTFNKAFSTAKRSSFPAGLFDNLDTSNALNLSSLFSQTFYQCGFANGTQLPQGIFSNLDTSNCTNFSSMFFATFENANLSGPVPADLFSSINTSNATNLSNMFSEFTSGNNSLTTIPATLFSSITVPSSVTSMSGMFNRALPGVSTTEIPATLFSTITIPSGVKDLTNMFCHTFQTRDLTTPVPATLFSTLNTSNVENFTSMFEGTFYGISLSLVPSTLFSPIDTSSGTNFYKMFKSTFAKYSMTESETIPSGLFANIDTSSGTILRSMFESTFEVSYVTNANAITTIPADLFGTKVFNADARSVFYRTFQYRNVAKAPQGLFGGLTIAPYSSSTGHSTLFGSTFSYYSSTVSPVLIIEDVFDGMSDFSWVTASSANLVLGSMFSAGNGAVDASTGSASTILQHFNFTPDRGTNMFQNRTNLTDYATINANWK